MWCHRGRGHVHLLAVHHADGTEGDVARRCTRWEDHGRPRSGPCYPSHSPNSQLCGSSSPSTTADTAAATTRVLWCVDGHEVICAQKEVPLMARSCGREEVGMHKGWVITRRCEGVKGDVGECSSF